MDLTTLNDILTVLGIIVIPYLAYIHRRIIIMAAQIQNRPTNEQVHDYVELKIKPDQVRLQELKEDIKEIKSDIKSLAKAMGCGNSD